MLRRWSDAPLHGTFHLTLSLYKNTLDIQGKSILYVSVCESIGKVASRPSLLAKSSLLL